MLTKRIIPCLDIKNGRTVKGVNFVNLIDAGDPVVLAKQYTVLGADELVFLDISATLEGRKTMREMVLKVAEQVNKDNIALIDRLRQDVFKLTGELNDCREQDKTVEVEDVSNAIPENPSVGRAK